METIRDLFSKDIDQHIEEVIKVDQANEEIVRGEISDYIVTDSIKDHFLSVYKAVADGRSQPHEGIGCQGSSVRVSRPSPRSWAIRSPRSDWATLPQAISSNAARTTRRSATF